MPVLQRKLYLRGKNCIIKNVLKQLPDKVPLLKERKCQSISCETFWFPQLEMTNIISKNICSQCFYSGRVVYVPTDV